MKNAMVMRFVKWRIAAWGARVRVLQKTLMRAPETPERNGRKVAPRPLPGLDGGMVRFAAPLAWTPPPL